MRNRCTGRAQCRVMRSVSRMNQRLSVCDRSSRPCTHGAGAGTIGSKAEKNDIGASTVDAHGIRSASATIGPAMDAGCVTTRSASLAVA